MNHVIDIGDIGYIGSNLSDTDVGYYWPIKISQSMYWCTPTDNQSTTTNKHMVLHYVVNMVANVSDMYYVAETLYPL